MRSPAGLLPLVAARLGEAGSDSAQAEAGLLLEALTGTPRLLLALDTEPLPEDVIARLESWVRRREQGEPLQLIIGSTGFYGLELAVEAGVLIPRPETETLVELALEYLQGVSEPVVVDIGCGSGAIGLAVAAARPDACVAGTDISEAALRLSARNARNLGLELELHESDLLAAPAVRELVRRADLLISNPPYLPEADRATLSREVLSEPPQALYSGSDGLTLFRRLLAEAGPLLRPGAGLFLELDPRNVHAAAAEARLRGFTDARVEPDLTGRPRFLLLRAP